MYLRTVNSSHVVMKVPPTVGQLFSCKFNGVFMVWPSPFTSLKIILLDLFLLLFQELIGGSSNLIRIFM